MRVLVTGAGGQLGYDVVRLLNAKGIECCGLNRTQLDITNSEQTKDIIMNYYPNIVIHCAAYTEVDAAESNIDECQNINTKSTANIADVCNKINAKLVYISTDYVFSGEEDKPYEIDSEPKPLSIYAQTKLDGEVEAINRVERLYIIRTSWSYGENGDNFVKTMLKIGKERDEINVVSDQIGSPTYTEDLALLIIDLIQTEKYGIYHATNEGYCSWAEFALEIFKQAGYITKVNFVESSQYATIAIRPKNSTLSKLSLDEAGFKRLPEWQDALARYLKRLGIT